MVVCVYVSVCSSMFVCVLMLLQPFSSPVLLKSVCDANVKSGKPRACPDSGTCSQGECSRLRFPGAVGWTKGPSKDRSECGVILSPRPLYLPDSPLCLTGAALLSCFDSLIRILTCDLSLFFLVFFVCFFLILAVQKSKLILQSSSPVPFSPAAAPLKHRNNICDPTTIRLLTVFRGL